MAMGTKTFGRKLARFGQIWLDMGNIKAKFGQHSGKIWAKVTRFEQI